MTDDPHPLAATVQAAAEIVADQIADHPVADDERAETLAAIHALETTTGPLHDELAGHFGLIDDSGRCECGRLVVLNMYRAGHKEGPGCLSAIPGHGTLVWLGWAAHHPEGIPLLGNPLVRLRLRRERKARTGDPSTNGHRPL